MREINLDDRPPLPRFVQLDWQGHTYGILLHSHATQIAWAPGYHQTYQPSPYGVRLVTRGAAKIGPPAHLHPVGAGDLLLTTAHAPICVEVGRDGMEMESMLFSFVPDPPPPLPPNSLLQHDLRIPFAEMLGAWSMEEFAVEHAVPLSLQRRHQIHLQHLLRMVQHQLRPEHRVRWFAFHRAAFAVLAYLVEHVLVHESPPAAGDSALNQVRQLLERNYAQTLSIASLAARVGWSSSHLCRRFKSAYGCSPRQYQILMRLRDAECLLTTTTWPVARVAQEVGFDTPDHFTRLFRRHTGSAPSDYRVAYQRGGAWPPFSAGDA